MNMISTILYHYRKMFKKGNSIRRGVQFNNSSLGSNINISRYSVISGSNIGSYSSIGKNATIINSQIGKFCSISWNVTIGATQHDFSRLTTHAFPYISYFGIVDKDQRFVIKTILGNDVWIGANVVIMPGLKIGHGAVIGAGSVVTKDVKDYEIVYGVPGKSRGFRFSEQNIIEILELNWWDWSVDKIRNELSLFLKPYDEQI